jgi:hypothetical protein
MKLFKRTIKPEKPDQDAHLPMNAYPQVYESDEQLRLNIALAIIATGIGLIALAVQTNIMFLVFNALVGVYGGIIIIYALFYILGTATRLRYQNPGEAQFFYISESQRRETYDAMVEMFWNGFLMAMYFVPPTIALSVIKNHYIGAGVAVIVFILVCLYLKMMKGLGIDRDRKTGNLIYNHNKKMRTAKEKREPFDAPPVKRK